MDDEYEYVEEQDEEQEQEDNSANHSQKHSQNVVSLKSMQQASSKMVLSEPRSYGEAQEIADNIVNRRAVVINLQRVDNDQGKRIIDFLSGTVYAINGDIQKLGPDTFLCTPDNVNVSGVITDTYEEDEIEKGW